MCSVWVLKPVLPPTAAVRLVLCTDPQGISAHREQRECSSVCAKSCQHSQINRAKGSPGSLGWQGGQDCCSFLMLEAPNLTGGKLHQRWDNRDQE